MLKNKWGVLPIHMNQLDSALLDIDGNDGICLFIGICSRRHVSFMLCGQSFTLVEMEHVIVPQERNGDRFDDCEVKLTE